MVVVVIKILIIDDHPLIRAGLRDLLNRQRNFDVVAESDSGKNVQDYISEFSADVLVTDLMMPGGSGQKAIREAKLAFPAVKVIVLSMYNGDDYVRESMACGADAYVTKDVPSDELVNAINEVIAGRKYISGAKFPLPASDSSQPPDDPLSPITRRERQVLILAAHGLTSVEIANELSISHRTAETHRANLLRKLGLHSQTELVHFAFRNGLVDVKR